MPRPALTLLSLALLALPAAAQQTRPRPERPDAGHRQRIERQEAPQRREARPLDRDAFRERLRDLLERRLDLHELRDRHQARQDDERHREVRRRVLKHHLKQRGVDGLRLRELRDRLRDHPEARERLRERLHERLRERRDPGHRGDDRDVRPRVRRT